MTRYGYRLVGVAAFVILFALGLSTVHANSSVPSGCAVSGALPTLHVGGRDGMVFAQAAYEFDANCVPVLVEYIRLDHVPDWVVFPEQAPVKFKTVPRRIVPLEGHAMSGFGTYSINAVNTCHAKTWEEDAPGLDMIWVQDDQIYTWNSSTVTLGQGSTSAGTGFSWWYINSGPTGTGGYYSSQQAWAHGQAGFYCNGGPFCGGGPTYYITLKNDTTMDYLGGCSGYGSYTGSVVPGGRVTYNVWKS